MPSILPSFNRWNFFHKHALRSNLTESFFGPASFNFDLKRFLTVAFYPLFFAFMNLIFQHYQRFLLIVVHIEEICNISVMFGWFSWVASSSLRGLWFILQHLCIKNFNDLLFTISRFLFLHLSLIQQVWTPFNNFFNFVWTRIGIVLLNGSFYNILSFSLSALFIGTCWLLHIRIYQVSAPSLIFLVSFGWFSHIWKEIWKVLLLSWHFTCELFLR